MTMTPEEICRHYQQAANKSKDISVLADLNATDKASIRAVLIDAGLLQPDKQKREPKIQKREATRAAGPDPVPQRTLSAACGDIHLAQEAVRPGPSPDTSIYSRLEAILAAIPEDASEDVRGNACELCSSLLWEYMSRRLGVKEG